MCKIYCGIMIEIWITACVISIWFGDQLDTTGEMGP